MQGPADPKLRTISAHCESFCPPTFVRKTVDRPAAGGIAIAGAVENAESLIPYTSPVCVTICGVGTVNVTPATYDNTAFSSTSESAAENGTSTLFCVAVAATT